MTLLEFKGLTAGMLLALTLITGFFAILSTNRYQKQLGIGDALANGVFIGAALFHLLPDAIRSFKQLNTPMLYLKTLLLVASSYLLFWLIEKVLIRKEGTTKHRVHIGILATILSIHALIAGLTLGISESFSITSILFIAILAHKSFEVFAFVINLYRQMGRGWALTLLLILFSFITPFGILLGILSDIALHARLDNWLTACFSAIAAGTFFYIGTTHSHHLHHNYQDSHHEYTQFIATLIGAALMGLIAIWM